MRNIIRLIAIIIATFLVMLAEIFLKEYKVAILLVFPILVFTSMLLIDIYLLDHDEEKYKADNIKKGE